MLALSGNLHATPVSQTHHELAAAACTHPCLSYTCHHQHHEWAKVGDSTQLRCRWKFLFKLLSTQTENSACYAIEKYDRLSH